LRFEHFHLHLFSFYFVQNKNGFSFAWGNARLGFLPGYSPSETGKVIAEF